jgi:redox-sensitive bicupin YhaK (pirin superfamily)
VRVALICGAPIDGPRQVWWDFGSSSKERIEGAKRDWQEGRFLTTGIAATLKKVA